MKAATIDANLLLTNCVISIHAAREGGDITFQSPAKRQFTFQSTPPVKAATDIPDDRADISTISIHAAREGGDSEEGLNRRTSRISIHAAREGGDTDRETGKDPTEISIHAAREGGDRKPVCIFDC